MVAAAKLDLKARNKTDAAFKKVGGNLERMDKQAKRVSGGLAAFAGGAVIAGLGGLAKKSLDAADAIHKMQQRTQHSAPFLSEMAHVAELSGTSLDSVEKASRKMQKSVEDAANGLSTAKRGFSDLNIDVDQFRSLDPDAQFMAFADAISGVEDPSKRTQLAMDLMGRSGVEMLNIMGDGSAPIAELREEAVALGQSMSQDTVEGAAAANDAMTRLQNSISGGMRQVILGYSDEIKSAADLTREYLPKALFFLGDVFKGLKVTVQTVILAILTHFGNLFTLAEKIPGIGDKFKSTAEFFRESSDILKIQIGETVDSMGKWKETGEKLDDTLETTTDTIKNDYVPAVKTIPGPTDEADEETKRLAASIKNLEKFGKEFADNVGTRYGPEIGKLDEVLVGVRMESIANKEAVKKLDEALKTGVIRSVDEYREVAQKLGIEIEETGEKTETLKELSLNAWRKLQDGINDSFKAAFKSGENFFKNLRDIAFSILAEIAAKIATTFVIKGITKLLGGTKLGNLLDIQSLIPGGDSGTGSPGLGDIASIGSLISKGASAVSGISVGAGMTLGDAAIIGTGKLVAGVKAIGAGISNAAGAVLTALGPVGATIAAIAAAVAIFSKGGRSPMQLGLDQLQAVDDATRAGRNQQVALGAPGGVGLSFLGGFNEHGTFFGVDLVKSELQKVGDVLKARFGFNQALALKDGVIRLEDFSREFSSHNDAIVSEVKASIVEVQTNFNNAERQIIASMGSAVGEMDRLFDASADTAQSNTERIISAYAGAFDTTKDEAAEWLSASQITADRYAEIFGAASNEVLEKLIGASFDGAEAFRTNLTGLSGVLNTVDLGTAQGSAVIATSAGNTSGTAAVTSEQENEVVNSVNTLVGTLEPIAAGMAIGRGQNQPLFNI